MHESEREHYNHMFMRRTMVLLIYHICMHVEHLYHKIFHAECWEFRTLCDKLVKTTAMCDLCLFLHKICCEMV